MTIYSVGILFLLAGFVCFVFTASMFGPVLVAQYLGERFGWDMIPTLSIVLVVALLVPFLLLEIGQELTGIEFKKR